MTSKERVLAALNHEEGDRVPLDIGGFNNTCMHELIEKEMKQKLGLEDHGSFIKARSQGIVIPDQSIVDYFGVDTCSIYPNENQEWIDNGDGTFTDQWHLIYKENPDGYYYNRIGHPLEDAEEIEDLDSYEMPTLSPYMLEGLSERLDANRDKFCILEGMEEPMFGMPSWLRRNENWYMDLVSDEDFCDALLNKMMDFYKAYIKYLMDPLGDRIDAVKIADDLGTQNSLLLSPETYRERIKPFHKELVSYIKDNWHKPVILHSCGAVRPLIGDFIDCGIDAVNPVQVTAAGMDPAELKAEFGDNITFWGGGVDTQQTLNFGTPDDVRRMAKKNLEIFKKNGGYVFCQVHNIQPGTPFENLMAMYETYKENCNF